MMVFYLVVMLRCSWILTLVGLSSVLITLAVSRYISKKRVNITRVQMRCTKTDAYLGLVPSIVSVIRDVVFFFLGVLFVMQGQFTVGMVMAFQGFLMSFTAPATTLIDAGQTIQEMRTQMERVEDVTEYPEDPNMIEGEEPENCDKLSGTLEMRHVTFGYSRLADPLIEDFNLSLKPGSRVAFVGGSGCGKSTLSKLISGLYQPWSGEILFDGKPIRDIDRSVFTGSLAVVDQDVILFEDTIAENIKMWDNTNIYLKGDTERRGFFVSGKEDAAGKTHWYFQGG